MRFLLPVCGSCYPAVILGLVLGQPAVAGADYTLAKNTSLEAAYIQSGYKDKVKQFEKAAKKRIGNQKVVTAMVYVGTLAVKKQVRIKTGSWRFDANSKQASLTFTVGF